MTNQADMAALVAGLPLAVSRLYRLRQTVRAALLEDLPVMGGDRFEELVDRVVEAVESLEPEPDDERARRLV